LTLGRWWQLFVKQLHQWCDLTDRSLPGAELYKASLAKEVTVSRELWERCACYSIELLNAQVLQQLHTPCQEGLLAVSQCHNRRQTSDTAVEI
jgi:hypothetical protein